jgi:hypothetical protein
VCTRSPMNRVSPEARTLAYSRTNSCSRSRLDMPVHCIEATIAHPGLLMQMFRPTESPHWTSGWHVQPPADGHVVFNLGPRQRLVAHGGQRARYLFPRPHTSDICAPRASHQGGRRRPAPSATHALSPRPTHRASTVHQKSEVRRFSPHRAHCADRARAEPVHPWSPQIVGPPRQTTLHPRRAPLLLMTATMDLLRGRGSTGGGRGLPPPPTRRIQTLWMTTGKQGQSVYSDEPVFWLSK